MGGCFSVSMSCDQAVNQVSQWLCLKGGYIHNLTENLASLEKAMGVLKGKCDDVQGRINREEFTGHHRSLTQVQVWLTNILTIENQYKDLLSTSKLELQRLCLCGFGSKNFRLSYRYGKRVIMMLREVKSLISQGEFDVVTEAAPIAEVEELPIQPTIVGQDTLLKKVWNRLMDEKVEIVGLHGMGGVGKTTLLMQINNKFSELGGRFDIIIWIVVSKNATVRKIQEDIGEKLGLIGKEWDEKNNKLRAMEIHNVLRKKKFVLLLDDIWEKLNLSVIGVLYPNRENRCKVIFTTRSRDVCGRMGVDETIAVSCLDTDKAWALFKKKVGENTLESHPDIPEFASKVAEKCRGLPLALNVIGETMASKITVEEWRGAFHVLTSSAAEFSGMEDEILPILKYSYDSLNSEQLKSCFLYCSLFMEDYFFENEGLIEYWIAEGFIDEKEGRERAFDRGYGILGTLVRACLLELESPRRVKMHDVVREMALWISSDFRKHEERCFVQPGFDLHELPKVKNWKNVKRMSLMGTKIEKIFETVDCPELTTLLLGLNRKLLNISGEFFQSMPKLLVLDLSYNTSFSGLPEQISSLESLRYLDLSYTKIRRLVIGVQELKMLIYLNLEWTSELEGLHGLSNLSSLRTLKQRESKLLLDMRHMKELQLLEHLEFISITISSSLAMEHLLYDPRIRRCIQQVTITECPEESVSVLTVLAVDNLCDMYRENCGMQEIKIEKTPLNKSFLNLSDVIVDKCDDLKDLTWLLFAPNLTCLRVFNSNQLEDIIIKENAAIALKEGERCNIVPFQKLEVLSLSNLPQLKSIYPNTLPFERLDFIYVDNCPKLRKLPLDSKSVFKVEAFTIYYYEEEWLETVGWENEATRQRFLPTCRYGPFHHT